MGGGGPPPRDPVRMELNPGRVRRKWLLRLSPVLCEASAFSSREKGWALLGGYVSWLGRKRVSLSPDLLEPSLSTSVEALIPRAQQDAMWTRNKPNHSRRRGGEGRTRCLAA